MLNCSCLPALGHAVESDVVQGQRFVSFALQKEGVVRSVVHVGQDQLTLHSDKVHTYSPYIIEADWGFSFSVLMNVC